MENDERCVCCGEIIPEGRMVCPNCEVASKGKRLIDANALISNLRTFKGLGRMVAETLVRFTEKQPTVDAVEVVHGRWLKLSPWNNHTQSYLCLNCDSISYQKKSGVYIGKIPNYCPNCGAKMDGDGNG